MVEDSAIMSACWGERDRALVLYNTLTKEQKDKIPQQLRVWQELPNVKNTLGHTEHHPSRTKVEVGNSAN